MAITSVAARSAYGIPNSKPQNIRLDESATRLQEGIRELADLTYSRKVVAKALAPDTQAAESEAATTGFSQVPPGPQKPSEVKVKSLLAEGEDSDVTLPPRGEVEALARRYLKVTAAKETGKAAEDKVKQMADFYGANPGRAQRLASLVSTLEGGDAGAKEAAAPSVAVA